MPASAPTPPPPDQAAVLPPLLRLLLFRPFRGSAHVLGAVATGPSTMLVVAALMAVAVTFLAAVSAVANVAASTFTPAVATVTHCTPVVRSSTSCAATDGLLMLFPGESGGGQATNRAANCRGYCLHSPVTARPRACSFCTADECETGVRVRGAETLVCCDEDACSTACGTPDKNCRYVERERERERGVEGEGEASWEG